MAGKQHQRLHRETGRQTIQEYGDDLDEEEEDFSEEELKQRVNR